MKPTVDSMELEIYKIIDSFLVEAKNQDGQERSLQQLNQDRHLAAEAFSNLFKQYAATGMGDSSVTPDADIITQVEKFAKDFEVDTQKYPRLKVNKRSVAFRADHNANGSGGWSEGEPAVSVPRWIVERYYKLSWGVGRSPTHNKGIQAGGSANE